MKYKLVYHGNGEQPATFKGPFGINIAVSIKCALLYMISSFLVLTFRQKLPLGWLSSSLLVTDFFLPPFFFFPGLAFASILLTEYRKGKKARVRFWRKGFVSQHALAAVHMIWGCCFSTL